MSQTFQSLSDQITETGQDGTEDGEDESVDSVDETDQEQTETTTSVTSSTTTTEVNGQVVAQETSAARSENGIRLEEVKLTSVDLG